MDEYKRVPTTTISFIFRNIKNSIAYLRDLMLLQTEMVCNK
jgi:hypothetical protein